MVVAVRGRRGVDLPTILYLVGCLILPAVWGWFVHRAFTRLGLERHLPVPEWSVPEPAGSRSDELYYQI